MEMSSIILVYLEICFSNFKETYSKLMDKLANKDKNGSTEIKFTEKELDILKNQDKLIFRLQQFEYYCERYFDYCNDNLLISDERLMNLSKSIFPRSKTSRIIKNII